MGAFSPRPASFDPEEGAEKGKQRSSRVGCLEERVVPQALRHAFPSLHPIAGLQALGIIGLNIQVAQRLRFCIR